LQTFHVRITVPEGEMNRYREAWIKRHLSIVAISWILIELVFWGPASSAMGQGRRPTPFVPPGLLKDRPGIPPGVPPGVAPHIPPGLRDQIFQQDLLSKCKDGKPDSFLKSVLEGIIKQWIDTINSFADTKIVHVEPPPSLVLSSRHTTDSKKFDLTTYWSELMGEVVRRLGPDALKMKVTLLPFNIEYELELGTLVLGAAPAFTTFTDRIGEALLIVGQPHYSSDGLHSEFDVTLKDPLTPQEGTAQVFGLAKMISFTVKVTYKLTNAEHASCDGETDLGMAVNPASGKDIALETVTVTVGEPRGSVNAQVFVSEDMASCDFPANQPPLCSAAEQPPSSAPFLLSLAGFTTNSRVVYDATTASLVATADRNFRTPGTNGPVNRADSIAARSNRYVLTSESVALGTPVSLTLQTGLAGFMSTEALGIETQGLARSHSVAQVVLDVATVFEGSGTAGATVRYFQISTGLQIIDGVTVGAPQTTLQSPTSDVINFGISNNVPVVLTVPGVGQQVSNQAGGSSLVVPLTAHFQIPIGQPFSLFVRGHADASGLEGFSSSSLTMSQFVFGPLPAGVALQALP
jgi:hypothetical protein